MIHHTAQGPMSRYAVGIDMGGTKIAGGLVDLQLGGVLARRQVATQPERGAEALLVDTEMMAASLMETARAIGAPVCGIGIGIAELVDPTGTITSDHAIPWRGVPVKTRLQQLAPVAIEADVRAHALAEARYGAGKQYRQFVFVTVGTGISSCLVLDGKPFTGVRGNALVFASSPVTMTCPACKSTIRPVLEEIASGPALVAHWNEVTGGNAVRAEDVLSAVVQGDQSAIAVVDCGANALGVGIGWLVNVLDPEAVIIGGGLGTAGGRYWDQTIAVARAHIWSESSRTLPIVPAALGPDAGLIGAAIRVEMLG